MAATQISWLLISGPEPILTGIGDASMLCVGEGELSLAIRAIVLSVTGVPPAFAFTVKVT
jgi:hypothetical protein